MAASPSAQPASASRVLNWQGRRLTDEDCERCCAWMQCLADAGTPPRVVEWHIGDCGLADRGLASVASCWPRCPFLRDVELWGNQLSDGARIHIEAHTSDHTPCLSLCLVSPQPAWSRSRRPCKPAAAYRHSASRATPSWRSRAPAGKGREGWRWTRWRRSVESTSTIRNPTTTVLLLVET